MYSRTTGQARLALRPSKKSIQRVVEKIHALTVRARAWQEITELVGMLNRTLRGWVNYFSVGTVTPAYLMRSRVASARVGSVITSCQRLTGTWLVSTRRAGAGGARN